MLNSLSFVMCGRSMMEGLISSRWMVARSQIRCSRFGAVRLVVLMLL